MNRRLVVPIALIAAAIALLYSLHRQGNREVPPPIEASNDLRYGVQDAQWRRYGADGSLTLRGHADSIQYFRDGSATATTLRLRVLGARGGPWLATAPSATLPGRDQDIELHGPVEVTDFSTVSAGSADTLQHSPGALDHSAPFNVCAARSSTVVNTVNCAAAIPELCASIASFTPGISTAA